MIWVKSLVSDHIFDLLVQYYELLSTNNELITNQQRTINNSQDKLWLEQNLDSKYQSILNKIKNYSLEQKEFIDLINDYNHYDNQLYELIKQQFAWYNKLYVIDSKTRLIIICFYIAKYDTNNEYVIKTTWLILNYFLVKDSLSIKYFNIEPIFNEAMSEYLEIINCSELSEKNLKAFKLHGVFCFYTFIIEKLIVFEKAVKQKII